MEEPGRLEQLASLQEEEVDLLNTPGGSQEQAKSQGKDLRHQLQLPVDLTLLQVALHLLTRLLPQDTRVPRIHLEPGQDTDHQLTLVDPVGQMQPMVRHQEVWAATPPGGGMLVAPILLRKKLPRKREKMRRSEIRAFNCER